MTGGGIQWHLSPMTPADCEAVWHLANDPLVRANALNPDPIAWETHQAWFAARLADSMSVFLAVRNAEGALIGQVRFEPYELPRSVWQLHYGLAESVRGKGLGRPVVNAAIQTLTKERLCSEVVAVVLAHNKISQKILESVGFIQARPSGTVVNDFQVLHYTFLP